MKKRKIVIGSRGSKLALIYANRAKSAILEHTEIENTEIEIKKIVTKGRSGSRYKIIRDRW